MRADPTANMKILLSIHPRKFGTPVHFLGVVLRRLCKGDRESKTYSLRLSWRKIIKVVEFHLESASSFFLIQILNFVSLTYDKRFPGV